MNNIPFFFIKDFCIFTAGIFFLTVGLPGVFAQKNDDLTEKIKWLEILQCSFQQQQKKMAFLENSLKEKEEENIRLNGQLNELKSQYLAFLDEIVKERKQELKRFHKAHSVLNGKFNKTIFPQNNLYNKKSPPLYAEKTKNTELKNIRNSFVKEKQILEARIFSLEAELELKNKELELTVSNFAKEKNILKQTVRLELDKYASFQTVLKEKKDLENKLVSLNEDHRKQTADLYYYLALAYTQAKIYPEAINAYLMSLEYDPNNSEAHYNLGLLYQYQENNPEKAVYHLRRSLKSDRLPENRRKIESLINILVK